MAGSLVSSACTLSGTVGEFEYETVDDGGDPDLEGGGDGDGSGGDEGQRLAGDENEARMISLDGVYANQGLEVEIAREGELLFVEERALDLIEGRETLITASWSTEPDFVPRDIRAVLHVFPPDQQSYAINHVRYIEGGQADPDDLDTLFNWILTPGIVLPGTEFFVELEEVDTSMHGTPFSKVSPRLPAKGRGDLHPLQGTMGMDVVLVPLRPEGSTFEIPSFWYEDFREQLYQFNPVQFVNVSVRAPIEVPDDITSSQLLYELQNARIADDVGDQVFYHGLFSPEFVNISTNGSYWETTPAPEDANMRVSTSELSSVEHSLHILGHNRGLQHIDGPDTCPILSGESDDEFPNLEGSIGTRGWGTLDGEFRSPHQTYDFMSFCPSVWVSDYHWDRQADYIRDVTPAN